MGNVRVFVASNQPIVRTGIALVIKEEASDMEVIGLSDDHSVTLESVLIARPDVALLDLEMSACPALEATAQIVEQLPETAVLVLGGYGQEKLMVQAFEAGARGFVLKNADVDVFVNAIRAVNLGAMFICPGVDTTPVTDYLVSARNGDDVDFYGTLSPRERELLPLFADCQSNEEIADDFDLSSHTIQTYRQRIMKKLHVHKQVDLLKYALRMRLIRLN